MKKKTDISNRFKHVCRKILKDFKGTILVAVSGGPDSVALLLAMKDAGVELEAVHCNFHLRGEESNRDMKFVENLCNRLHIRLHIIDFDVEKEKSKEESVEMACRRLRYARFRQLLKDRNCAYIALGHNADDNIETLLMNLLRGSGTTGLKAMKTVSGDLIRPLLSFSRQEIERYLKEKGQSYVTDHTNLESDYRRNFLRNDVIPLLESRWEGARKAISKSISFLQEENEIIENSIKENLCGAEDFLEWKKINQFPSPTTLIFRFIQPFGGSTEIAGEIGRSLPKPANGKSWNLTEDIIAFSEREGLRIIDLKRGFKEQRIEFLQKRKDEIKEFPQNNKVVFLPGPIEKYELVKARKDMSISPLGMKGTQDVMKILKDGGISTYRRESYPVLIEKETGEVIWIPGLKRSRKNLLSGNEDVVWVGVLGG